MLHYSYLTGFLNLGHNILELYNYLIQVRFATSKMKLDIKYNKLGKEVVLLIAERLQA